MCKISSELRNLMNRAFGLHMASYIIRELLGTPASQLLHAPSTSPTPIATIRRSKKRDCKPALNTVSTGRLNSRAAADYDSDEFQSSKGLPSVAQLKSHSNSDVICSVGISPQVSGQENVAVQE
jgi:hypothetical protein